jgi:hypothetical protein
MTMNQLSRGSGFLIAILLSLFTHAVIAESTAEEMGFFDVYQQNREQSTANYITEDFLLLAYSMIRQQALEHFPINYARSRHCQSSFCIRLA